MVADLLCSKLSIPTWIPRGDEKNRLGALYRKRSRSDATRQMSNNESLFSSEMWKQRQERALVIGRAGGIVGLAEWLSRWGL
ncbi:hypothetical protein JZ751_014551 [Albula glossodonta]|uniref:Uncharacterized protein n=1 Tax=Albula glossodonta TaxID=121402 RepID=A0A8T2MXL9_9TELE|nr:hypothetical protein JZ751_014551 [Albula glossodonta]